MQKCLVYFFIQIMLIIYPRGLSIPNAKPITVNSTTVLGSTFLCYWHGHNMYNMSLDGNNWLFKNWLRHHIWKNCIERNYFKLFVNSLTADWCRTNFELVITIYLQHNLHFAFLKQFFNIKKLLFVVVD